MNASGLTRLLVPAIFVSTLVAGALITIRAQQATTTPVPIDPDDIGGRNRR